MTEKREACERLGISINSAQACGRVAKAFELHRRRCNLSFSIHKEVCSIDEAKGTLFKNEQQAESATNPDGSELIDKIVTDQKDLPEQEPRCNLSFSIHKEVCSIDEAKGTLFKSEQQDESATNPDGSELIDKIVTDQKDLPEQEPKKEEI